MPIRFKAAILTCSLALVSFSTGALKAEPLQVTEAQAKHAAIDKPALKPLPVEPFDLSEWSRARVNIDYHVSFDANLYSVPMQ